jgi:hypothetical protein
MAINLRIAAVLSCAFVFSLAPAAFVCAQTQEPAAGEQTEQPPASGQEPLPPMPAGVPAAEAPRAEEQEQEPEGDEREDWDWDGAFSRGAAPATAGMNSPRAFSGLFRGAAPSRREPQTLDLSASVYGVRAEGNTLAVADRDGLDDGTTQFGGTSLSLAYGRNWTEAYLEAVGTGSLAYVPKYEDRGVDPWTDRWSVGAAAGFSRELTPRVRVRGSGNVDYSPYFQQDLLSQAATPTIRPPLVGTPGLDFALARDPLLRSVLGGSLSYRQSRRASLEAYYSISRRDFLTGDTSSYLDQIVGGRYLYRINEWVGLRAGYGLRTARVGADAEPIRSHDIDVGADGGYGRSFALSRRTTFSFNTGSSVFVRERFDENSTGEDPGAQTRLFVNGSADLTHAWGLTWSANLGAARTVNYELGFREPLFSNGVYAGFGGLLAPRLDFTTTAAYTSGSVGFGSGDNGFGTASATAALRLALARWLAAYGQYFYYQYDFETGVTLPGFLQRGLHRQGVSVGLTTSFPLIGPRGRR